VSGLAVVRAEGDVVTRGRTVGAALGDSIGRSLAFYREVYARRGLDPSVVRRLLAPHRAAAGRALPEHVAWLEGVAVGAQVPFDELFAVNAFEELEPLLEAAATEGAPALHAPERCSTFVASGPGSTLLGHNEMWLAGDAGNVAVLVERPAGGVAIASPTAVACLPAVGLNAHRAAQGIDSLVAADDREGVPRVLVSRHALDAAGRDDALRRAQLPERAGGYAHVLAFAGGDALTIETTALRAALLDGPGAHTNHYLDQELATLAPAPSQSSARRLERLRGALAARPPGSVPDAMAALRDTAEAGRGAEDAIADDEASVILFSMVCDVEAGRMWVASGDPSVVDYEEVDVGDVV